MATFFSPDGNIEVWEEKPNGYFTAEEWQDAHPSPPPMPPTSEQLFTSLRTERDTKLRNTDKYLLADYPITADALEQVKIYRATLRALPDQLGAPWPNQDIPWPVLPTLEV